VDNEQPMKKPFELRPTHIHLMALINANLRRPSTELLAREMKLHKNTIYYHLKALTEEGYLDKNGLPTEKARISV